MNAEICIFLTDLARKLAENRIGEGDIVKIHNFMNSLTMEQQEEFIKSKRECKSETVTENGNQCIDDIPDLESGSFTSRPVVSHPVDWRPSEIPVQPSQDQPSQEQTNETENPEEDSEEDFMKFIIMGWYIYNMLAKNEE